MKNNTNISNNRAITNTNNRAITRIAPTNKTTSPVIPSEGKEARNPFKSNLMKSKLLGKNILKTKDYKLKTNYGFTLVELIVVIVILGILATIAFLSFSNQSGSARDGVRMGNTALISKGMDLNITIGRNINTYDTLTGANIVIVGSGGTISYTGFYDKVGAKFLDSIKVAKGNILDDTTGVYRYTYIPSNKYYQVGVTLENNPSLSFNDISSGFLLLPQTLPSVAQEGQNVLQVDMANAATSTGYAFIKGNFPINTASGGYVKGLIPASDEAFNSITPASGIRSISGTGSDVAENSAVVTSSATNEAMVIPPANSCNATIPTCSPGSCDLTYNPTNANQSWIKDSSSCGFACKNSYTGTDCMTPPAPSCNSTIPTNATTSIGSPTVANQAWQTSDNTSACHFVCNSGYGYNGTSCVSASNCTTGLEYITLSNGQSWSCKNLGATTVWDGATQPTNCGGGATNCNSTLTWLGDYYQWGRNVPTYASGSFINGQSAPPYNYGWEAQNDTAWGGSTGDTTTSDGAGTTKIGRIGPCPTGWHVPSVKDWQDMCNSVTGGTCSNGMTYNSLIATKIRLPFAGYRGWSTGNYNNQSTLSYYWSSSPTDIYSYHLYFNTSSIYPSDNYCRAFGFSVRCLKN